jgi:ATP-dependent DNA ligase
VELIDVLPSENRYKSFWKKCVWVLPEVVAQVEYLEWTEGDHLRHAKFAGLREDKNPLSVVKEHADES